MASLNTSTNGPSISKSYQSVVNAAQPSGAAASSPTYGQWAVFSVSAPLANAFQQDTNKESVLKVQSTGEGELVDLVDDFSDGRIQFAFVKVKDSNTGLPKNALIAWCGEGVPERTKGYFTSHLATVAKLLHGYHVQITARSDRDLTPEGIIQKVADASGSKYSAGNAPPPVAAATKPVVASKPAFTPTQSTGGGVAFNPLRARASQQRDTTVDEDGWGADAPPVTRTQLEKVPSAYERTKVDMRALSSQPASSSTYNGSRAEASSRPDYVGTSYQPIGKVDIAAIRRQAQDSGSLKDDRPEIVRGSYEPVGKVDIAAIRAKAQKPSDNTRPAASSISPAATGDSAEAAEQPKSLADRSAAFTTSERLTSLPKPKIANKFGGSSFAGTKAPLPGGFEAKPVVAAPVGGMSRTFADEGGKTPAQIWAEKKARERGMSGSGDQAPSTFTGQLPINPQTSGGGGEWKSGYAGKTWAPVQTTYTGKSASSIGQQRTGDLEPTEEEQEAPSSPAGGISSLRDRFSGAPPMGAPSTRGFDRPAPEPDANSKPNRGIPIPGFQPQEPEEETRLPTPPPQPPRSATPPTPEVRSTSPIRVAMPVGRGGIDVADARDEQFSPPPVMSTKSLDHVLPEAEDDEPETGPDPGRGVAQATAAATMGHEAVAASAPAAQSSGERAKAEYDYDADESNEVTLKEGEIVTDVDRVDADWWLVTNAKGERGLVPSNYLSIVEGGDEEEEPAPPAMAPRPAATAAAAAAAAAPAKTGPTATALYDYEAAEDNELSFPENATIENVSFPDEDWWYGEYDGKSGLFPANYTKLDE